MNRRFLKIGLKGLAVFGTHECFFSTVSVSLSVSFSACSVRFAPQEFALASLARLVWS